MEITVYEDRSFTFITKTPPAAVLIKEAIGIDKGSGEPHVNKVGTITAAQVRQIAERKMPDLNANDLDAAEDHRRHGALDGRRSRGDVGMAHGKRYREMREKIEPGHQYEPAEAISLVKESGTAKFDEAVEFTPGSASTFATPRSSCAAPWPCPAVSARTSPSPSSPRASRPAPPRRPAPISSAPPTSPRRSRAAGPTSTSRSRPRP